MATTRTNTFFFQRLVAMVSLICVLGANASIALADTGAGGAPGSSSGGSGAEGGSGGCQQGPQGCCLTLVTPGTGDTKAGQLTQETCPGKPPVFYGDCLCVVNNTIAPAVQNLSYAACSNACKAMNGTLDPTQGVGRHPPPPGSSQSGTAVQSQNINALCWTPQECDEAHGTFAGPDLSCPAGRGKCKAPEPVITLSSPILGLSQVTGIRNYIAIAFQFAVGISIMAAAVMLVWGGTQYIFGSSAGSVSSAKDTITNAIIGLILMFSATAILRTINPATVSYDKLDIFMINKVAFNNEPFCSSFKARFSSQPLKFADSGDPPQSTTYDKATFNTSQADTVCGKQYYAEYFNGATCTGSKCADQGKVCLSCAGGATECGGDTKGYACVKAIMAGNVTWSGGVTPKKILLLGVCNHVQPASGQKFNSSVVAGNVPGTANTNLSPASGDNGTATYVYGGNDVTGLENQCASQGGLRGIVMGVIYKDNAGGTGSGAAIGAVVGGVIGLGAGAIPGAAIGAKIGGPTVNDTLIVTKKDCGNSGTSLYSAYADGTTLSYDSTDMKTAIYCGAIIKPNVSVGSFNDTFYQNNMWTADDFKKAMSGGDPIKCDFGLTPTTAPPDPGTKFMGGCKADWCPSNNANCD